MSNKIARAVQGAISHGVPLLIGIPDSLDVDGKPMPFVYTIGRSQLAGDGYEIVAIADTPGQIEGASELINYLTDREVKPDQNALDRQGNIWGIVDVEPMARDIGTDPRQELTQLLNEWLGRKDYPLLVMTPVGYQPRQPGDDRVH